MKGITKTEETPAVADHTDFKCGYVVGITTGGTLLFKPLGSELGVVELLGLHALASHRLKGILDVNQGTGDALTVKVLEVLQQALEPVVQTGLDGNEKGGE